MSQLRCSHDISGCMQRLTKMARDFQLECDAVFETWQDSQAARMQREHLNGIVPSIERLVTTLQGISDIQNELSKKVHDPHEYQ